MPVLMFPVPPMMSIFIISPQKIESGAIFRLHKDEQPKGRVTGYFILIVILPAPIEHCEGRWECSSTLHQIMVIAESDFFFTLIRLGYRPVAGYKKNMKFS
jgi:hypothetical protein